ncbi:shikimate dehydrogenase [Nitratifractor sp.]|uniref:shikimate dehydrogenase n=1 Tax=Nitratifractor sp. TaxID=2268144 RepID=UPI0025FBE12D|nr:shikimate dehydrogenase [Nitratifractor sp.]
MPKELFAIFGDPVSHSKSPLMHNWAFRGLGYPGCYTRYRLPDGEKLRETFFALGLRGVNVTVPHKEAAYRACDELDSFARQVGAVNTVVEREGRLYGYNTDAPGFLRAIETLGGKDVLFLGAGGTARATAAVLREAGYRVTLLNRSAARLEPFREAGFEVHTWEDFRPRPFDLVVNMTSAGLKDEALPAPEALLKPVLKEAKGAVDVVYGRQTPFLALAKAYGLPAKDGSDMLLYQGVIAFDLFTGGRFSPEEIEAWMRKAFDE